MRKIEKYEKIRRKFSIGHDSIRKNGLAKSSRNKPSDRTDSARPQQSEDLKEKLGKLSEKLWETPKPFSEKPPSPFYEDKPLKKIQESKGYVPLTMLLSFVQEETIAKEILEVNSKYADLISKEGGINEEITTNWTTEITNI